jgi:hypothetical protein
MILLSILIFAFQKPNQRILDLYTKDERNPAYLQQLTLLATDQLGMEERDLVIVKHVMKPETAHLFESKHISTTFMIILTGKDGREKFRSSNPVALNKLYGIIDVMPMRKDEIKAKQKE